MIVSVKSITSDDPKSRHYYGLSETAVSRLVDVVL